MLKVLAWIEIAGCIGLAIFLIVMAVVGDNSAPWLYLRGLIVLPFGLWWGLRMLRGKSVTTRVEKVSQAELEKEQRTLERERVEFLKK